MSKQLPSTGKSVMSWERLFVSGDWETLLLRNRITPSPKLAYEESLALLRQVGHKHNEGECLMSLGDLALAVSDPLAARSYFDTALNICSSR